jgi:hypothetical protein
MQEDAKARDRKARENSRRAGEKGKSHEMQHTFYLEQRKFVVLLQISQNSSPRSADETEIKLKTLLWLEAVV